MRAVVVPGAPALLPGYRSLVDPVADLRRACRQAVAWLVDDGPEQVAVRGEPPWGPRVGRALLEEAGFTGDVVEHGDGALLVVANGTARRGERAPGYLDERSFGYDARIERALLDGDGAALTDIDAELGAELMADGVRALRELGAVVPKAEATALYADDPFGVRYWVVTWERVS